MPASPSSSTVLRRLPAAAGAAAFAAAAAGGRVLVESRRFAGTDLTRGISILSNSSRASTKDVSALTTDPNRLQSNKMIVDAMHQVQVWDQIEYRKRDNPWEIVPKYAKRRVVDLVGILTSAHRMEIEETIEKMQPICDVEMYVVIVPTVGYVTPRCFAHSLFFDWQVGEPRGNGLLMVIAQHEGSIQLVASPGFEEYFHQRFVELLVKDILQPHLREGDPSYAIVQTVYAVARHAHEMRDLWSRGFLSLPVRNKVRWGTNIIRHGVFETWTFYWSLLLAGITAVLWNQLLDAKCPKCHRWMAKEARPEGIMQMLTKGQQIEYANGCIEFKVWRCQHCDGSHVRVLARDYHHSSKCLKCDECTHYTVNLTSTVRKLPTKDEDGIKELLYACENCRVARQINLPLFRPLDMKPPEEWYNFLLQGAAKPSEHTTLIKEKTNAF